MEREEFVQILGVAELAPIEVYLQAVATQEKLPVSAIAICTALIEEAGPALRAGLAKAADGEILSPEDDLLAFRGLHILGAARDTLSWPILLSLLRRPADELDIFLDSAITLSLPRIAAGLFDGDAESLFALIADQSVEEFVRSSLFGAATFLTWEGRIERDHMRAFLERFYAVGLAPDRNFAWRGWLLAIALLGQRDLAPLFHRAWDEGRIDPRWQDRADFEKDLTRAEQAPDDIQRFEDVDLGYIEDVVDALSWTDPGDDDADADATFRDDAEWLPEEPYVNPWRDVGRNDPCPCGSGKKAKKCCLGQQLDTRLADLGGSEPEATAAPRRRTGPG